jgi:hypothetical protein
MKIECSNCGKIQNIPDIYVNRKTVKCVRCKVEIPVTPSKSSFPKKTVLTWFAVFFGLLVLIIILAITSRHPKSTSRPHAVKQQPPEQKYKPYAVKQQPPEQKYKPYAVKQQLSEQKYKPQKKSLAYMLATIDNGYVSEGDISITRFRSLLNQLDQAYVEDQQTIADMTVMARKILRDKYGIDESLHNIMEGMNQIFYQHHGFQYAEYVTVYVQLRKVGKSHSEAVRELSSLVHALMGK